MDRLLSASPRPKWLEAALPIVVTLAALAGCSREPRAVNVLIVSIDTLRADHLGCYGYAPYAQPVSPRIDEFAKRGLLFEECSTARGQTAPSLGSLMTGLYPSRHGVLDNGVPFRGGVRSLAQQLMAAGYDAHAFVSFVPGSRSGRATLGIPPEHVFEAQRLHSDWAFSRCDEAAEQSFVHFVEQRKSGAKPFFAWVHFYDVHQPYTPPPPYDTLFAGDYHGPLKLPELPTQEQREAYFKSRIEAAMAERMLARAPLERDDARYLVALYDGGIRETDERVGRVLDALDRAGLRDETLVVLTADHGEELGQHNAFWFHGNSVHAPVLHVPLIVGGPGVRAGRCSALIQNVDVAPTLLEWVGVPPLTESDGLSFAKLLRPGGESQPPPRAIAWSEWQDLILGARTADRHLIFNPRGARPKKAPYFKVEGDGGYFVDCAELYDVVHDPLETKDLWDEQKEAAAELRARVAEEYGRRGFGGGGELARDPADPKATGALKAAGYPEAGEDTAARRDVVLVPESCRERH